MCWVYPASAAVRVVDDEVFFTLTAPGAREVFLVGDFNNWNPTVERMPRSGDVFEISLYLVEGSYRYKFVVDGRWLVDPDNPGSDPARGSPLVLVEKPAGLMLITADDEETETFRAVHPGARYIGRFTLDGDDFESGQMVDLHIEIERDKLRADAVLKTVESSWDWGETQIDVTVDRGFLETKAAGVRVRAFENDSTWISVDPIGLIGDVGLYDYNAGRDRKGVAAEFPMSDAITIRGVYADHTGILETAPPLVEGGALAEFAGGGGADTVYYTYDDGVGGADLLGFEVFLDAHDFQLGYARRHNQGIHRGLLAEIERTDSLFARTVYDTRENFAGAVYWLRIKRLFGAGVEFGFGRGESRIHKLSRGKSAGVLSGVNVLERTRRPDRVDTESRFETSNRYAAGIDYGIGRLDLSAQWDRTSFAFDTGVYNAASAAVNRTTLRVGYDNAPWSAALTARHTHQAYEDTPADLIIDSPSRNLWLDGRDNFSVADLAAFDADSYLDAGVTVVWGNTDPDQRTPSWLPSSALFDAGVTTDGLFESRIHTRARVSVEKVISDRYVLLADGRAAAYHRDDWPGRETFLSGYLEIGYRTQFLETNLGYGFDPVVFDPVVNEYRNIGRSEHLRGAIGGGVKRGDAALVGQRLMSLERALEAVHVLKLECILRF
jgi:hypothetical protein